MPILQLLVMFAIVGPIGAVAHGHFPFPLLWLGVALWWFRPWTGQRHGQYGRPIGKPTLASRT